VRAASDRSSALGLAKTCSIGLRGYGAAARTEHHRRGNQATEPSNAVAERPEQVPYPLRAGRHHRRRCRHGPLKLARGGHRPRPRSPPAEEDRAGPGRAAPPAAALARRSRCTYGSVGAAQPQYGYRGASPRRHIATSARRHVATSPRTKHGGCGVRRHSDIATPGGDDGLRPASVALCAAPRPSADGGHPDGDHLPPVWFTAAGAADRAPDREAADAAAARLDRDAPLRDPMPKPLRVTSSLPGRGSPRRAGRRRTGTCRRWSAAVSADAGPEVPRG
jgi:hypothetical protein